MKRSRIRLAWLAGLGGAVSGALAARLGLRRLRARHGAPEQDRRSGTDRRSGAKRRAEAGEPPGALERRSGTDRRSGGDRRADG